MTRGGLPMYRATAANLPYKSGTNLPPPERRFGMTDKYDSLYDTVNARRFGSLRSDDSVTETMCDAFFETRSSLEDITKSVQGAMNAVGDQPVQSDKAIEHNLPVCQDRNIESTNGMVFTHSTEVENLAQDLQRGEENENCSKSSIVAKPVGKLVSASHAKSVQPSKPPRLVQRETQERKVIPIPASRPRDAALQNNTPIAKQRTPTEKDRGDNNKDLRSDFRKMKFSTDRQARDRTPRSNVSGAAATKKAQHSGPVRIRRSEQTEIRGDLFLKNDAVPSEREFRQELNNRNPSLGSVRRGISSTPKNETKEPQSDDFARTSVSRNRQIHGPINRTLKPQASSVSRVFSATPVASNTQQSKTRSSSATRTIDRPLNIARSTVQRANTKHYANDAESASQSLARPSSAARLTAGPQSVNRPNLSKQSHNQPVTAQSIVPVKENGLLASVKPASTQRSSGARDVAVQSSAQRRADYRPPQPRPSVIRHSPIGRGGGDGTPVHGFRKELRRYPIPTTAPSVEAEPSSVRRLSRNELRAMVERLAVPKRVATMAMRTPLRIRSEQTHGVSCIKIRSRSSSLSRRPVSAQDNISGVPAAGTLLFSTDENPRSASVEPGTQQELK
ncbi:unnamed protein product [Angiostrongylus costaricensis]|uniref:CLASP_N domain-containing protein n=1 Tax=Angiostrongylus costaricensis TaxID=334426 RepID=A0A0R3PFG4_ANGCS|nr:unnamed protein product [Angiostrongylus costaricensis]